MFKVNTSWDGNIFILTSNYSFVSAAYTHFQNYAYFFKTFHRNPRIAHTKCKLPHISSKMKLCIQNMTNTSQKQTMTNTFLHICTFAHFAHSHALHTLSHCTSYPLFYFIICFLLHSHHICIYIYSLVFLFHSFYCFYVIFILLSCFIFLSCTFHWADLSWLTFHYLLYPVWLCMWQIIKNLEPWTLNHLCHNINYC